MGIDHDALEKPVALPLPAGGQWMYPWFSMTTVRNFFYKFYNDWHEENMLYEIEI